MLKNEQNRSREYSAKPLHFTDDDRGVLGGPPSKSEYTSDAWKYLGATYTRIEEPAIFAAWLVLHKTFWPKCTVVVAALHTFSTYPEPAEKLKFIPLIHLFSLAPQSAAMAAIATQCSPQPQNAATSVLPLLAPQLFSLDSAL